VHPLLLWENPDDDARLFELGRAYREDLRPFSTGATYLNFLGEEGGERLRAGFGEGDFERLVELKRNWDPDDVFRGNHNLFRSPPPQGAQR
jgi:Berberine and berberine like